MLGWDGSAPLASCPSSGPSGLALARSSHGKGGGPRVSNPTALVLFNTS